MVNKDEYSKVPKRSARILLYLPFCCKIVHMYHGEGKISLTSWANSHPRNAKSWKIHWSSVQHMTPILTWNMKTWKHENTQIDKQELSYRNHIARKLRTQYAEGIYRHKYYTVTLKSRLRVTQGHWKRNYWIDHTRLSSSRFIWRRILSWSWNVG